MKNTVLNIASLFVLTLVVSISASAQMSSSYKAEVPFDFTVGGKTLAAGEYRIERTNPRSNNGQIAIRNAKTKKAYIFNVVETGKTSQSTNLVFANIDGQYFLEAIDSMALDSAIPRTSGSRMTAKASRAHRSTVALKPSK